MAGAPGPRRPASPSRGLQAHPRPFPADPIRVHLGPMDDAVPSWNPAVVL